MSADLKAADDRGNNAPGSSGGKAVGCLWRGAVSLGLWLVHFLALFIFTYAAVGIGSECRQLLQDVGMEVPPVVELFVHFCNMMFNYWYLLFVPWLLIDGPVLLGLQFLPERRKWLARLWFRGWLTVILLGTGLVILWIGVVLRIALPGR
ncbi:MAG: hypothetical protein AB7O62_08415 [Pirellulales bacterium]